MRQRLKISRNQFMKSLLGTGVITLLPFSRNSEAKISTKDQINSLIKVINEQGRYNDYKMWQTEINNLTYAFENIRPTTHQELAFVVACGSQIMPYTHIVDEYIRRKKGYVSQLPDHPILTLNAYCVPDTQRILVFKEQILALLRELSGWGNQRVNELLYNLGKPGDSDILFNKDNFISFLNEKYRRQFSSNEIDIIHKILNYYVPHRISYFSCSTMASRGTQLA